MRIHSLIARIAQKRLAARLTLVAVASAAFASRVVAQEADAGAALSPEAAAGPAEPGVDTAPVAAAAAPPERASDAPAESQEMVVTSQRYEQSLQDAPVAVTAFSPSAMDRRGITNLQDVGKFTPNLELHSTNRPGGGGSAYAAYIRGIGTGDFQFPTDPGVGLYIDDVYMGRTMGGLLSIDVDIERVEVIKGPQGTLFGRNTIGGAFNIVTTAPETSGEAFGTGLLRLGSYGRKDFAVMANAPLLQDKIGAKLAVASLHSDGFGERVLTGEKTNDEERLVLRGGLRFTVIDDVDIRLNGDYSRQDQNPPNGRFIRFAPMLAPPTAAKIMRFNQFAAPALNQGLGLPMGSAYDPMGTTFNTTWISPGPYDNYALQPVFDRYDMGGGSLSIQYRPIDEFGIKSVTAARAMGSEIAVDGDQTPYSLQTSQTDLDQQQYSEELQFGGLLWDARLRWLVGLYAYRETGDSTVDTESFHGLFENEPVPMDPMMMMMMLADAADTLQHFELTATSYAAFTQETLTIIPGLNLTLGARINRDEKRYTYSLFRPQVSVMTVPEGTSEAAWNSFTPKAGIDWKPIEEVLLYVSYAHGFKSGGFGPSNQAGLPRPMYDPETVVTYEVGVKTDWFEHHRLTVNLAAFYNDYRDIQLTVQAVDPVTNANVRTTQNAGSAKIPGFEAELTAVPVDGLVLNAGLGYVDARFDSVSPQAMMAGFEVSEASCVQRLQAAAMPTARCVGSDRLPQIPDLSVNGGIQFSFDAGIGELTLRGDVTYKGDQFLTAADPSSFQDGVVLYGARIAYVPAGAEELELSLQGINLSDEVYYVYHATLAPTGQEVAIAAQPRLVYAMAKYFF